MTLWDVMRRNRKGNLFAWRKGVPFNEAAASQKRAHRRRIGAILRPRISYTHVTGDKAGLNRALISRLNKVGKALGRKVYIRDGVRSYAEQVILYERYLAGKGNLAAFPGTSNHGKGRAADCQLDDRGGPNIGDRQAARREMKRVGLCLPVAGEKWHVEVDRGQGWKA